MSGLDSIDVKIPEEPKISSHEREMTTVNRFTIEFKRTNHKLNPTTKLGKSLEEFERDRMKYKQYFKDEEMGPKPDFGLRRFLDDHTPGVYKKKVWH